MKAVLQRVMQASVSGQLERVIFFSLVSFSIIDLFFIFYKKESMHFLLIVCLLNYYSELLLAMNFGIPIVFFKIIK